MDGRDESELYDVDEVEAILSHALKRSEKREGLTEGELREIAREVGIDDATLGEAIVSAREDRLVEAERTRLTSRRRSAFGVHFFVYAMVNLLLFVLARRLGLVSMLGWGVGLLFHALSALPPARLDRASVLRKVAKRKQRRERERHADELRHAATVGATEAIRAATSVLERSRGRTRDPRGPEATPPRVRVEAEDAEVVEEPEPPTNTRRRGRR